MNQYSINTYVKSLYKEWCSDFGTDDKEKKKPSAIKENLEQEEKWKRK